MGGRIALAIVLMIHCNINRIRLRFILYTLVHLIMMITLGFVASIMVSIVSTFLWIFAMTPTPQMTCYPSIGSQTYFAQIWRRHYAHRLVIVETRHIADEAGGAVADVIERVSSDPEILGCRLFANDVVIADTLGWPWPAFRAVFSLRYQPAQATWHQLMMSGMAIKDPGNARMRSATDCVHIPIRPMLIPIVLNTCFYACIIGSCIRVSGWARVRLRQFRGKCLYCGYSLTGLKGLACPECGQTQA